MLVTQEMTVATVEYWVTAAPSEPESADPVEYGFSLVVPPGIESSFITASDELANAYADSIDLLPSTGSTTITRSFNRGSRSSVTRV